MSRPPRPAVRLLSLSVRHSPVREDLLADLERGFRQRAAQRGSLRASLWYWRQVLGVLGHRLWSRLFDPEVAAVHRARRAAEQVDDHLWTADRARGLRTGPRRLASGLLLDFRVALRSLRKRPGFSVVVLTTLALGIGANTAIFSIVSGILLKPLPYPAPERIVRFMGTYEVGNRSAYVSYPDFHDVREATSVFSSAAAYQSWGPALVGDGEPERLNGMMVSEGFFDVLGVEAAIGRTFLPEEDVDGRDRVVVLSWGFWQRRLGGDPGVVGRSLTLNGTAHTVVGVAPERFASRLPALGAADLWRPLGWGGVPAADLPYRGTESYLAVARLREDVTLSRAREEVAAVMAGIAAEHPDTNLGQSIELQPLQAAAVEDTRTVLLILFGAVTLVLAIAVANVGNLLLGRAVDQEGELAVRAALGAGRLRLLRQLVVEGLILAGSGGLLGLGLAALGTEWLIALSAGSIPLASEVGLDYRVLTFTASVAVVAGVGTALVPAFLLRPKNLHGSLQAGGSRGGTSGARQLHLRGAVVTSQVALSVVLLLGAGLLVRSLEKLSGVDPGVRTAVLTFRLSPTGTRYPDEPSLQTFYRALEEELEAVPGVRRVAFTTGLPMTGRSTCGTLFSEEEPSRFRGEDLCAEVRAVSPDYFEVMGIPIRAGRGLEAGDGPESPDVVVINRATAELLWPGQDPLGRRLATGLGGDDLDGFRLFRVVGVVPDVKQFRLDEPAPPQTYLSVAQWPRSARSVIIEGEAGLEGLAPALRRAVWAVDDQMPVTELGVLRDFVDESLAGTRFRTVLIAAFAALALILTVAGLYGVVSYSVTRRRGELAVRLALGAAPANLLRLIVGEGLGLVLPGLVVGLLGALALSGLLRSLLFGVTPWDPVSFVLVPLVVTAVSVLASLVPARRSLRMHPASALRTE